MLPVAEPPLSEVSKDEDEDDDNDSLAMIISNLFPHGPGVGGVVVVVMSMGRRKAMKKTMMLIFPTPMMPTACLMLK